MTKNSVTLRGLTDRVSRLARDQLPKTLGGKLIRVQGLAWTTRPLIWLGLALLIAMTGALFFTETWRSNSDLVALPSNPGTVGRGTLVPAAFAPATVLLLAVAWSFLLVGALHAHPLIRAIALLLYELQAAAWLGSILTAGLKERIDAPQLWFALALLAAVPIFFAARWRAAPQPVGEFAFLLLALAWTVAAAQRFESGEQVGIPLGLALLNFNITFLGGLVAPLLLVIGVDLADSARQTARSITDLVTGKLPRAVTLIAALLLFAWRGQQVIGQAVDRVKINTFQAEWPQYLSAFGELWLVGILWLAVSRLAPRGFAQKEEFEQVKRVSLPLGFAYSGVALAIFLLLDLAAAMPGVGSLVTVQSALIGIAERAGNTIGDPWHVLMFGVVLFLGLWVARRQNAGLGLYLAIFGGVNLYIYLTTPGNWLGVLAWEGSEPSDFGLVLIITLFAAYWIARRELNGMRVGHLIFLLLITLLLGRAQGSATNYSSILSFTGIALFAIGIAWDALTAGAWTNEETPALPRVSRIMLYLGYILLTLIFVNWALISHDLKTLGELSDRHALTGLALLGKPLLYSVVAVTLGSSGVSPNPTST